MGHKRFNTSDIRGKARRKILDLTGQRFGKLEALEFIGMRKGAAYWRCRCDCGQQTRATVGNLRAGHVKSCGCGTGQGRVWVVRPPEYALWMRRVRFDTTFRGFEDFLRCVGSRPSEQHWLVRPNPSRPYGPKNCQWSELRARGGKTIQYRGKRLSIKGWAEQLAISGQALRKRLARYDLRTALSPERLKGGRRASR
jgi:hypothetical protein